MNQIESEHQQALFQWAGLMEAIHPELAMMFHVPNGGKRDKATAIRLKAEGVKPGVPDIVLPVARGNFHSLWIELKVDGGKPSPDQLEWQKNLRREGHCAKICYGWDAARQIIEKYLKLPKGEHYGKFQSQSL